MKSDLNMPKQASRSTTALLVILSIVFSFYYIDLGFAFKPVMILSILIFILSIKSFEVHKLEVFEIGLVLFYFYYMLTGFMTEYPTKSARMIFGVLLVLFCYFVMRFINGKR